MPAIDELAIRLDRRIEARTQLRLRGELAKAGLRVVDGPRAGARLVRGDDVADMSGGGERVVALLEGPLGAAEANALRRVPPALLCACRETPTSMPIPVTVPCRPSLLMGP